MQEPLDLHLGDIVRLRKAHPCGSTDWKIVRVGGDIGVRCLKCGRRVLLPRSDFRRSLKKLISRGDTDDAGEAPSDRSAGG